MSEVAPYVQDAGQIQRPLKIGVTRENGKIETELMPQKEEGEANYKLGLYIRDSAAGIGTMTFFILSQKNMVL